MMEFTYRSTRLDIFLWTVRLALRSRLSLFITAAGATWISYSVVSSDHFDSARHGGSGGRVTLVIAVVIMTILLWAVIYGIVTCLTVLLAAAKMLVLKSDTLLLQEHQITLEDDFFETRSANGSSRVNWCQVESVDPGRRLLILWLKGGLQCYVIPTRFLPADCVDYIRSRVHAVRVAAKAAV